MARHRIREADDDLQLTKRTRRTRRIKKRYWILGFFALLLAGVFLGVPYAAQNRSLVVSLANRYSGIDTLRIDLDRIQAGWFKPIQVHGLRILDLRGNKLVEVGSIETEKGMLGFAMNSSDIGTVTIKNAVALVEVQPGTTNLEEALKPLLSQPAKEGSSTPTGRIRIESASLKARDTVDLSAWEILISDADIPLPTASQPIPAMTLNGLIRSLQPDLGTGALVATQNGAVGQISARVEASTDAVAVNANSKTPAPLRLVASAKQIPLQCWSLLKRRMPELPIDRLQGLAQVQATVTMASANSWMLQLNEASLFETQVYAPTLLGNQPAKLKQLTASGRVTMTADRIIAEDANLECDAGKLVGSVSMPIQFSMPTATKPWIDNAEVNMQGAIDVASLTRIVPGLITMQEKTQLTAGRATITAIQQSRGGAHPVGRYSVELGDLVANVGGVPMEWKQALNAEVSIESNQAGQPTFNAKCIAEFCELTGQGDYNNGDLKGKVDLDRLQQRLSKWISLPITQLSGNAQCDLNWKQDAEHRIQLNGNLVTTPVRVGLPTGMLNEPAWKGRFDLIGRMDNNSLSQVDRAVVQLNSSDESLQFDLLEPISMIPVAAGMQPLPPASIHLKLVGDILGWQKRGQMFAGVDPGISVGGRCDVTVKGQLDLTHVEITEAQWNAEPFTVKGSGFAISEPKMQGDFAGRVDSQALSRLQVDKFTFRVSSFAVSAMDAAQANGSGRTGKAAFVVDSRRLLSSIDTGTSSSELMTLVDGVLNGSASWTLDTNALTWQLTTSGKDLKVVQTTPKRGPGSLASTAGAAADSVLWVEPEVIVKNVGRYNMTSGAIDLPETTLQSNWIAYAGVTAVTSDKKGMQVSAKGNVQYDSAQVVERLKPWLGNYVAVRGERTEPVEITWNSADGATWSSALQAKTRIGWDSANVIGIDVGKADVPIIIENGHLKSKTEIPVSQGALRWDMDGDVGGDPIIIHQAPEVVLENIAITPMMCQGWLKYVAPLLADVTKVEGKLSLQMDEARIVPTDLKKQKFAGQLQLHGATVGPGPLSDQLLMLVQQIRALRKGATAATATNAQGSWLQMPEQKIDFAVDSGRVMHKNLQLTAGDIIINTSGEVAIDGTIQMTASVPIRKEWIDSTPALASLQGQSLQLPIGGTLQRPQIDFRSLGQITMQMAQGAAQGYLSKQVDKGLNKLLGPMQQQLQNIQQGLPLPQGIFPGQAAPAAPAGAAPGGLPPLPGGTP